MTTTADSDWTFGGLWPFAPRWFDTPDGRLHYVDEGPRNGRPVVLLHGNATWGFLYREFVKTLVEHGHRAIVPDHLGFGRSDKPPDPAVYEADRHVARLGRLLDSLDLRDVVLASAEWGTPIGLAWAVERADRIGSLFLMNSPDLRRPTGKVKLPMAIRLLRSRPLGSLMVLRGGAFTKGFLFKAAMVNRERLTERVKEAYLAPHPDPPSRVAQLAFARQLPSGPDDRVALLGAELLPGLRALSDRPVTLVWAMQDVSFSPAVLEDMWIPCFPQAEVVRIEDAGHCLQEDAPEQVLQVFARHLERTI